MPKNATPTTKERLERIVNTVVFAGCGVFFMALAGVNWAEGSRGSRLIAGIYLILLAIPMLWMAYQSLRRPIRNSEALYVIAIFLIPIGLLALIGKGYAFASIFLAGGLASWLFGRWLSRQERAIIAHDSNPAPGDS